MSVAEAERVLRRAARRSCLPLHKILARLADVGPRLPEPGPAADHAVRRRAAAAEAGRRTWPRTAASTSSTSRPPGCTWPTSRSCSALLDRLVDGRQVGDRRSSTTKRSWRTPTGSSTSDPGAGHDGGRVVFEGTPADLVGDALDADRPASRGVRGGVATRGPDRLPHRRPPARPRSSPAPEERSPIVTSPDQRIRRTAGRRRAYYRGKVTLPAPDRPDPGLPVIDLSLADGLRAKDRARCTSTLRAAATEVGFFQLIGHGVTAAETAALTDAMRSFFALPEADRLSVSNLNSPHFRGYTRTGDEHTAGARDWRDQMDIGAGASAARARSRRARVLVAARPQPVAEGPAPAANRDPGLDRQAQRRLPPPAARTPGLHRRPPRLLRRRLRRPPPPAPQAGPLPRHRPGRRRPGRRHAQGLRLHHAAASRTPSAAYRWRAQTGRSWTCPRCRAPSW